MQWDHCTVDVAFKLCNMFLLGGLKSIDRFVPRYPQQTVALSNLSTSDLGMRERRAEEFVNLCRCKHSGFP